MLGNLQIFTYGAIVALVLYWSLPPDRPGHRQLLLTVVSAALVFLYSIGGFVACFYLAAVPLVADHVFAKMRNRLTFWLAIAVALLPLVGFRLAGEQSFHFTFGVAFATVKSLGLVMLSYSRRTELLARDVFLMIFFFPLFTVGPVERLKTFTRDNFQNRLDYKKLLFGGYRIAVGLFLTMFICDDFLAVLRDNWYGRSGEAIEGFGRLDALGLVVVSFLYTYLNFEGFSSIAIGLSRLFGLQVIENFARPLMVTNIAEFWKRYHISMGNWINQFLFLPLVILIKKPWANYVATVLAFVFFGLWHAFTLNYIVWGLANGIGVSVVHFVKSKKIPPLFGDHRGLRWSSALVGGIVTIAYVAWAQTFANMSSFEDAVLLTYKLFWG